MNVNTADVSAKDKQVFLEILLFLGNLPDLHMTEEQKAQFSSQLRKIEHRLEDPFFNLAIIGDFSSGKSSFINALLHSDLLKTAVLATTAVPTRIRWNSDAGIEIQVRDRLGCIYNLSAELGRQSFSRRFHMELPDGLSECIDAITTSNALAEHLDEIQICLPRSKQYEHICLIDTPGVNPGASGTEEHVRQTQNVLRESADATLILFPSPQVFKADFSEFLRANAQHLLNDAIFIVTKMDLVPLDERDQMMEFVERQLTKQFQLSSPEIYGCSSTCAVHPDQREVWDTENWSSAFGRLVDAILERIRERRHSIITAGVRRLLEQALESAKKVTTEDLKQLEKEKTLFERHSIEHFDAECDELLEEFKALFNTERQKQRALLKQKIQEALSYWKRYAYSEINKCTNRNVEDKSGVAYVMKREIPTDVRCSINDINKRLEEQTEPLKKMVDNYAAQLNRLLSKYDFNMSSLNVEAYSALWTQMASKELTDIKWSDSDLTVLAEGAAALVALPIIGVAAVLDSFLDTDITDSIDRLFTRVTGMFGVDSAKSNARSRVDTIFSDLEAKVIPSSMDSFDSFCQLCIQQANEALCDYVKKYEDIFKRARDKHEAQRRRLNARLAANQDARDGIEKYVQMIQNM